MPGKHNLQGQHTFVVLLSFSVPLATILGMQLSRDVILQLLCSGGKVVTKVELAAVETMAI